MAVNKLKNDSGFKKELRIIEAFSIASGAMISSGIFVLPGIAFAKAGPAVFLSYFFASVIASMGMLSQAELISAMPKAGGDYFYITRSLGPAVGTVNGLLNWFSLSLKSSFALVGIGAFANVFLGFPPRIVGVAFCLLFLFLNLLGTKKASRFQVYLVISLLVFMVFYIFGGLPRVSIRNYEHFMPYGFGKVLATSGFVFISYGGLLKVAALAEEVKNPGKTIPQSMILSLFVVGFLYMMIVFTTTGILSPERFKGTLTPISDGAEVFLGSGGRYLFSLAAVIAFFTTANAGIMAASRYPLALSRDRLLPSFLLKTSRKNNIPYISIMITGGFIIVSLFLKLEVFVKAASTIMIFTYIFACLSVIILRESKLVNYQPVFKVPFYPWMQIFGMLGYGALIFEMGLEAVGISGGLALIGIGVYLVYGKKKSLKEYALLYLIRRITARELVTRDLEDELREIIRKRDEITIDRFDRLVEKSVVLDIEEKMTYDEFFRLVSKELSNRLKMPDGEIHNILIKREKESSTAITPTVAIPHIVIPGEKKFDILIARAKSGICFTENAPSVKIIFVLAGSRDERNFHLRALSSIAQIIHDPGFQDKWMSAKTLEDLRDIILLGKRTRA